MDDIILLFCIVCFFKFVLCLCAVLFVSTNQVTGCEVTQAVVLMGDGR